MRTFADALDILIFANARIRKRRRLARVERELQSAMALAFRRQGRVFLSLFASMRDWYPGEKQLFAVPGGWDAIFDAAASDTHDAFAGPIDEMAPHALEAGGNAAILELSFTGSFDLDHPAAVAYLRDRGATQVRRIQETTRNQLRTILVHAADEGWSYNRTAAEIRQRFAHFSKQRAKNIAVFELGDAYEHGNMLVAKDLQDRGLVMQKSWLSVGDHRVRPAHRANQAQGWIPLDSAFQDGSDRPPTTPRCRCTLMMRRKPDGA